MPALAVFLVAMSAGPAGGTEEGASRFDLLRRTKGTVIVHVAPRKRAYWRARVHKGAVLRLARTEHRRGCPEGWMEREGGGFVCAAGLGKTDADTPAPAPRDRPGVLEGAAAWVVERGGARMYRREKDIDRHTVYQRLLRESFLMVTRSLTRYGTDYHRTREGLWVTSANTRQLPPPIRTLRVEVGEGSRPPLGIAIEEGVEVLSKPEEGSPVITTLDRWSRIDSGEGGVDLEVEDGWVRLPSGGFALDDLVARVRQPEAPKRLDDGERWIAVDLREQMLLAFEGERLVMAVPCSTGKKGNTRPGSYRVQWKRRMQTMRLRGGHLRVEDVQWVMYYDRRRSIAIHSAYWHSGFGKPLSHGCVNLPTDDARWLYEWALPLSLPEDSENFQSPAARGTRVVVFR